MYIIDKMGRRCAVNEVTRDGLTALIAAAYRGLDDICLLLIEKNVDLYARTNIGFTALTWAAENDHYDICRLIIKSMLKQSIVKCESSPLPMKLEMIKAALLEAQQKAETTQLKALLDPGHIRSSY